MNIAVIGTGYVGLVTGACLSEMGNDVQSVDLDIHKIEQLKQGKIPIYEPGLEEIVKRNIKAQRLSFTTDFVSAVTASDIIFVAVGTPPQEDGDVDLSSVMEVASSLGKHLNSYKVIAMKSTVPVGTGDKVESEIKRILAQRGVHFDFDVVSNPEFLKEGAAVEDFMRPDRVIIGTDNLKAQKLMERLYSPFVRKRSRILLMDRKSGEMSKYASNAMLAARISYMNEIARLCERMGVDVTEVRRGVGSDSRIGPHFIYPGLGYGGSCFPKDVKALIKMGEKSNFDLRILSAVDNVNQQQREWFTQKIIRFFGNDLKGKKIGVWGLAFKPETDDIRGAPSLDIITSLTEKGAQVVAYDLMATEATKAALQGNKNVQYVDNQYKAIEGADALVLVTEWREFREPNFQKMKKLMKQPVIFDGRNMYSLTDMDDQGYTYISIGRKSVGENAQSL